LSSGRTLSVADLVTRKVDRSKGFGAQLSTAGRGSAAEECRELTLDSGVQRVDAHRFYLMKRTAITKHHFGPKLDASSPTA
jgi:hypothetical protein